MLRLEKQRPPRGKLAKVKGKKKLQRLLSKVFNLYEQPVTFPYLTPLPRLCRQL